MEQVHVPLVKTASSQSKSVEIISYVCYKIIMRALNETGLYHGSLVAKTEWWGTVVLF